LGSSVDLPKKQFKFAAPKKLKRHGKMREFKNIFEKSSIKY